MSVMKKIKKIKNCRKISPGIAMVLKRDDSFERSTFHIDFRVLHYSLTRV